MVSSVLDAIFAQAKAAVTRAYLAAGLLPAVVLALGWQLYRERSISGLRTAIDPLLAAETTKASASVTVLFYTGVVIVIGIAFYVARGVVLRTLRDLPGPLLQWLRDILVARQTRTWIERRRVNVVAEHHWAVAGYLSAGELDKKGPSGYCAEKAIDTTIRGARAGFATFELLVRNEQQPDRYSAGEIMSGLLDFYSLPQQHRQAQLDDWKAAIQTPFGKELTKRLYAVAYRRALEMRQEIQEQPLKEWRLAPTRLGNVVAALDDYAMRRYKISTSTLFTRLWGTLGGAERTEIASAQLTLESFANVTVAFAILIAAVIGSSMMRFIQLPPNAPVPVDWWTIGFVAATVTLCCVSYSATVFAFQSVAENITRLIDLHRVRILTAFGFAPPQTFEEEQALFGELNKFFTSGTDKDLKKRKLDARQNQKGPAPPATPPGPTTPPKS